MKTKDAKAQLEVWEWKQKAWEEVKHLSVHDVVSHILKKTQPVYEKMKRRTGKRNAGTQN